MIDGPSSLKPGEMPALRALEQKVFRPSMPDEYPQVFKESNADDLIVCFDGEKCVSHVGMVRRSASIYGCTISLGLIGGVATDDAYRGQGLAGKCCDYAFTRANTLGLDLLLVSGDRSLYQRRDCVTVGGDWKFSLDATTQAAPSLPHVQITPMRENDLARLSDLYRQEPVRFLRQCDDYTDLFGCGIVFDQPTDFLAIRTEADGLDGFSAYVLAPKTADKNGVAFVSEVGGDRYAVAAALPQILRRCNAQTLRLHVSRHDTALQTMLRLLNATATPSATSGTVRIVNFPQLMEKLRPLWVETLGREEAGHLSFAEDGDTCIFRVGDDVLRLGRGDAARLLFGTPDNSEAALLHGVGESLAQTLRSILPVPALWYGLSFV